MSRPEEAAPDGTDPRPPGPDAGEPDVAGEGTPAPATTDPDAHPDADETGHAPDATDPDDPDPDRSDPDDPDQDRADPDRADPDDAGPRTATTARRGRRDPLAAVLIGVLTLLLGFAFAVQVRNSGTDEELAGVREEDLVRILDDLSAREDRLRQEIADQRAALDQLGNSDSAQAAALEEAQRRAEALGILNGTIAAQGPGLELTIRDPQGKVPAATLLNAVQELRGAGAETMQVDGVRIGVSSAITGTPGDLEIDGQSIQAPYEILAIGSPEDMATAMSIPGGVAASVRRREGDVDIVQSQQVVVDALRPLDQPQYAEPDSSD